MIAPTDTCWHCGVILTEKNIANIWECFDCAHLLDQINNQKKGYQHAHADKQEHSQEKSVVELVLS